MDFAQHIFETTQIMNEAMREHLAIGREQGQREGAAARDALRAVVASYDAAIAQSPDLPIPTPMMCALEACRRVIA